MFTHTRNFSVRIFSFSDRRSTVRQNDSDRTKAQIIKIDKIDSVQNSTNTVYNIDNVLCTGMLDCAHLSMC